MKKMQKPIVIDVRNPDQFADGHAEGSINIPLPELENRLEEVRKLGRPVICVCGGGTRNGKANTLLHEHGIDSTAGGSWKKY